MSEIELRHFIGTFRKMTSWKAGVSFWQFASDPDGSKIKSLTEPLLDHEGILPTTKSEKVSEERILQIQSLST